ncbi:MAG: DUF2807 domain-containing protein [Saprospiraceae bacterium]|uniref:DUF2807 domain-containing protein n=1 Tax=Candidatus Opimibacter skivensis TaxID=2982028 RepID=A0A9D7XMH1_9BACT|nr:DUF2807 domain-containing protein [Candidatus Opimibacter skivensis]
MKTNFLLYLTIILAGLQACEPDSSSNRVELKLDTEPFDRISLASSCDIKIIQSDIYQVTLTGRQKDIDDVDVNVISNSLNIAEHGQHPDDFVIRIYVPEIKDLDCSGSSFIYGESNFTQNRNMNIHLSGSGDLDFAVITNDLDLEISGSANVLLEGSITNLDAEITGSGWVKSFKLQSDFADVRITGSGSAEVNVTSDLDALITGSGNVFYKGHPHVSSEITGSGKVIDAN